MTREGGIEGEKEGGEHGGPLAAEPSSQEIDAEGGKGGKQKHGEARTDEDGPIGKGAVGEQIAADLVADLIGAVGRGEIISRNAQAAEIQRQAGDESRDGRLLEAQDMPAGLPERHRSEEHTSEL